VSFLDELKRRNVGRVAIAYAIVAWIIVEAMSVFVPALKMPEWIMSFVALAAIIGFPIALVLSWVYELTPAGLRRTNEVPVERSIARVTAQKLNYLIIGALAVALVFVVVDAYLLRENVVAIEPAAAVPAPAAVPSSGAGVATQGTREVLANSVAVLPFANLSPNADDAYFAQGIHEEVLNQLAKLDALSVIARTSVLRYADGKTSLPDIARELNVQTVMEGSVRYAGDNVRITAQLIDPETGRQLWSEAYQRKFEDIFTIQADIAMNIANALRAEFSLEEQREIERPLTTSPEAYALYLQTRTPTLTFDAMLALLDRAIALDPSFAPAHGRRALINARILANSSVRDAVRSEDRTQVERLLRESAQRALALDPTELQARAALDSVDVQRWYWSTLRVPSAQQMPDYTPAGIWAHAWKGDLAAVLPICERWAQIDPNALGPHLILGVLYAYAGNREASDRALRRSIEVLPGFNLGIAFIAYNAVAAGDTEAALEELTRLQQVLGDNPPVVFLPEMAYAYGRLGRRDEAQRLFALIETAAKERDIGTGGWALAYLAIGDENRAVEQLEAAAVKVRNHEPDAGYLSLMNLKMNFLADPLMATPRFAEVLARIVGD
jgi:TolB-like protein